MESYGNSLEANPTGLFSSPTPGSGPVRTTNQQRKQARFRRHANELFAESLRIYLGMKNKWVQEHELATLCPARINAIQELYFEEFKSPCPWFPQDRLSEEEAVSVGLQSGDVVGTLDVEAVEFKPTSSAEVQDDSGISTAEPSGSVTPILIQVSEKLAPLESNPPADHHTLQEEPLIEFGDFEAFEVDALAQGVETAVAVPSEVIDFISDVTDRPVGTTVQTVICPVSAEASSSYYGTSLLADILQHVESSILVKSLMDKPKVSVARTILGKVRGRVCNFIAIAERNGLLHSSRIAALINSLCDDAWARTRRKLLSNTTKWKLKSWLIYMRAELYKNRLSKHIAPDLRLAIYHPRTTRAKSKRD